VPQTTSSNIQRLEFRKLTKLQLIDYFKHLLKDARKTNFISNVDLEKHDLFKLEHIDISFLEAIVQEIGKDKTLDDITSNMEEI
jgi:hypothetical protein